MNRDIDKHRYVSRWARSQTGYPGRFTPNIIRSGVTKISERYNAGKSGKLFTILSSCYNKEEFIKDCLRSVATQDYRPLMLAWIDDGSTDKSLKTFKRHSHLLQERGISFVLVSSSSRLQCSSSYKNLLSLCSGSEYYGILDSDDELMPGAVSFVASLYNKYPEIGYIWTQFQICDFAMTYKKKGISRMPDANKSLLETGMKHTFSHWRTFSNRIDISKVFRSGVKAAVDKDMGYNLEELGLGMFVDKECYKYREGVQGSITGNSKKTKQSWAQIIDFVSKRRIEQKKMVYPIREEKIIKP